jgi:hypothetical protein
MVTLPPAVPVEEPDAGLVEVPPLGLVVVPELLGALCGFGFGVGDGQTVVPPPGTLPLRAAATVSLLPGCGVVVPLVPGDGVVVGGVVVAGGVVLGAGELELGDGDVVLVREVPSCVQSDAAGEVTGVPPGVEAELAPVSRPAPPGPLGLVPRAPPPACEEPEVDSAPLGAAACGISVSAKPPAETTKMATPMAASGRTQP